MKRNIAIILTLVLLFSCTACGKSGHWEYFSEYESGEMPVSTVEASESVDSEESVGDFDNTYPSYPSANSSAGGSESGVDIEKQHSGTTKTATITGVNGKSFNITEPDKLFVVNANSLKLSGADCSIKPKNSAMKNTMNLAKIAAYLKSHPNTELSFEKGVYYFAGGVSLNGLKNIRINGNGSEFINKKGSMFGLSSSDTVEFKDIIVDWNWEAERLADLVKVVKVKEESSTTTVQYQFLNNNNVDENMIWMNMYQYDPTSYTPGALDNKEVYFPAYYDKADNFKSVTKISDNVLEVVHPNSVPISRIAKGDVYMLRHKVYNPNAFNITGDVNNLTFNGVKIYSYPGMGYLVYGNGSNYHWNNCSIDLRPDSDRYISTTADGINISNVGTGFCVENSTFGYMGDDSFNIHTKLAAVQKIIDNNTAYVRVQSQWNPGDTIRVRTATFDLTETRLTVKSMERDTNATATIVFNEDITGVLAAGESNGSLLYNENRENGLFILRNNYVHHNRARGVILESSYGLVENCKFEGTQMSAIQAGSDVKTNLWQEGSGVNTLTIRNNEFIHCNTINCTGGVVFILGNIYGNKLTSPVSQNVTIQNNQFVNMPSEAITLQYSRNSVITGNTFRDPDKYTNLASRASVTVDSCWSSAVTDNTWYRSPYVSEPGKINIVGGVAFEGQLTQSGNKVLD